MIGFSIKQEWKVVYSSFQNTGAGLMYHYVEAFNIQKALTQAKNDLPRDAQIVRIQLVF